MTRHYSSTAQPTTLAASCTSVATSIQVTATTGFPAVDFVLALDFGAAAQELVLVTNVSGTTLTVTRGYDSTSASAHSLGAAVQHVHAAQDFRDSRTHEAATSGVHGVTGALVGTTDTQAISNKDFTSGTNTFPGSLTTDVELAAHAALTATHGATGALVGTTNTQTLTNKSIDLTSNTLTGTRAQFNAAITDDDFASLTGTETLTNKTLTSPVITEGGLAAKPLLVCTSATRPAHAEGQAIYETDTDKILVSNGTAWNAVYRESELFLGTETAYVGTNPPVRTAKIVKQDTVVVSTAANGSFVYTFPTAFPNGIVSVICQADSANGCESILLVQAVSAVGHINGFALDGTGAAIASTTVRFMYTAVGW